MPVVHNPIKTNSDLDVYPTHEAKLGKGGYRTVANIAERDNIPFERCEEGMLVTVLEDNTNNNKTTTYILKQNTRDRRTWEKFINDGVNPDLTNRIVALETSSAKVDNEIVTLSNEISTKVSLNEHNNLVASLSTYALKSDLNTLATKDELNDKLDVSTYTTDKATFATKDELNDKADLSSLDTLTTKDELNNLVYTKSQVDKKIADAITGGSINLDGYVKKDEIVNLATKDELNNKADRSDLDAKANISDLQNLATKAEVNAKLDSSVYASDKATFATKTEVNAKLDVSTYTADKNTLATKDELNLKADLSSLDDLATKTELNDKLDVSTYTTDKATFTTKDELNTLVYTKSQVDEKIADVITGGSINLDGYVKKDEIVNLATKDELNGKLDVSTYTTDKDTFATKTQLEGKANKDEVYSKTEIDDNYTTTEQLNLALSGKADKSTVDSLATKVEVNEKISKLATKEEMASGLATKADSSIIPTLATKAELSSLATKDELNLKADLSSLDDLATKAELNNKADRSDLQNLATKEKVDEINSTLTNAIATKANADSVVNLTDDQTIAGVKTFSSNITSPNITAIQNNLDTIFSSTSSPVKTQTTNKIITVGNGGDFQDLLSALNEVRKYTSFVEIRLVSDLQINQRIDIYAINGMHININFQNYKITNTTSQEVRFAISEATLKRIHNLNLENITFSMSASSANLSGNININNTLPVSGAIFGINQSAKLNITPNATVTINSTGALFFSGGGGMMSFSSSSTITTTTTSTKWGLFTVGNGGFMTFYQNVVINKPSELKLYNIAVNTPSMDGLILDKTGRI